MIFHENSLPADNSHDISYLFFVRKLGKMWQNLSSAAVEIGALRFKGNYLGNCSLQTAFSYCIFAELLQHIHFLQCHSLTQVSDLETP